jgi:hypothetical protein
MRGYNLVGELMVYLNIVAICLLPVIILFNIVQHLTQRIKTLMQILVLAGRYHGTHQLL